MATSLIEIASDLAAQYPNASPDQITEIILSSIESESIISRAIAHMEISTKAQLRLAEFRSERFPKQRSRILKKIENAHFLKRIQEKWVQPLQDSVVTPGGETDGARVDLSPSTKYPDRPYQGLPNREYLSIHTARPDTYTLHSVLVDFSYPSVVHRSVTRNTRETNFSSSYILQEIDKAIEEGHFLSLYDVYKIINVVKVAHEESTDLDTILKILKRDIKLRNRIFKSDCVRDLYLSDEPLPLELCVPRPKSPKIVDILYENIRAIIVNEYKRLHNECGQQFIDGEITYDVYIQTTQRYAIDADRLISACR